MRRGWHYFADAVFDADSLGVGKGISNKDYIACSGLISLPDFFHYPPILFKFFHF